MTDFKTLRAFHQDAGHLDQAAFADRHGEVFLVHHGPSGKLNQAAELNNTQTMDSESDSDAPFDPGEDFLVFPLRRRKPPTPDDDLIWIGRSEDNDVCVPDASVSAIHAFVKKTEERNYVIQDMNSMNGTEVSGHTVPAQGMGDPKLLRSGERVRLGAVSMTFLEAAELFNLILQLLG